jgi:hypothetical protein
MKYEKLGQKVGKVVDDKQIKYGDSYGKSDAILKALYPNGIHPEQYKDLLFIVRVNDKLSRIATSNDKDGENPAMDIAGYSLLKMAQKENLFEKHKKIKKSEVEKFSVLQQLENIVEGKEK